MGPFWIKMAQNVPIYPKMGERGFLTLPLFRWSVTLSAFAWLPPPPMSANISIWLTPPYPLSGWHNLWTAPKGKIWFMSRIHYANSCLESITQNSAQARSPSPIQLKTECVWVFSGFLGTVLSQSNLGKWGHQYICKPGTKGPYLNYVILFWPILDPSPPPWLGPNRVNKYVFQIIFKCTQITLYGFLKDGNDITWWFLVG